MWATRPAPHITDRAEGHRLLGGAQGEVFAGRMDLARSNRDGDPKPGVGTVAPGDVANGQGYVARPSGARTFDGRP
jgi:hypothetical protein